MQLQRGRDVGQQHKGRVLMSFRQRRSKGFEHSELGEERAAVVHVQFIFPGPMKGLPRENLQSFQVNPMPFVKLYIPPGKIFAHDSHEFDRAEKAGRHGGMAGRTPKEPRIFGFRSLDGVKGGGTDYEDAHSIFVIG